MGNITEPNVKLAVPFFRTTDMATSLQFYVDGLGFKISKKWIDGGKLRWCWLEIGDAAIMLQEFHDKWRETHNNACKLGEGVSIAFQCADALAIYRDAKSRGIAASKPFVGNRMWVTTVEDPDGYVLEFESLTDVPEETVYEEEKQ